MRQSFSAFRLFAGLFTALLLLVGCSGGDGTSLPAKATGTLKGAAEPGVALRVSVTPAGRSVTVGAEPEGIVVDTQTRTVAVAVRNPDELVLLDADSGDVRKRVPLPGVVRHLQLARPGGPVLVPDESAGALLTIGLPGGDVLSSLPTGDVPHDANEAPNGTIFVANEQGGTVVAVRDNKIVKTFDDTTQPAGLASVGDLMGLIDVGENTLTLYNSSTLEGVAELRAGDGPTHLVADKHGRMIATDTRGDQLLVFSVDGQARITGKADVVGKPYGIAYDSTHDRVWVTATSLNLVIGYDMSGANPREVAPFPTVQQPNTVGVDSTTGQVFVTGTHDGVVQIISTE